jgi:myosin-5
VLLQQQRTITAMGKVGIPAEQRESVFATVASVLHLGNISFVEGKDSDSSKVAPGKAQEHLQAAGATHFKAFDWRRLGSCTCSSSSSSSSSMNGLQQWWPSS